ncbi:uncharacterized protein LOC133795215 [Humulus lupulus]|uniref:uncharacterized protein LOC133795215 n=1 Tax=Humulus lupulus TaxID=3486 RepID=UPI002B40968B|nr:uncharacterized protein LOC133795215 [Humulus lupulus]
MPVERAFDLHARLASKKKSHKCQFGEGCSNPPTKKSRTNNPPAPTPTKETTPPPASAREATPPTPINPDPPSLNGQTPPLTPVDPMPPTSTVQQSAGRREEASGDDLTGAVLNSAKDRLSRITKHRHSQEAIQETDSIGVDQVLNHSLNEELTQSSRTLNIQFKKRLSDQLSAAEARYTEQLKATEATHAERLKAVEAKNSNAIKEVEAKHTEALKEAEAKHLKALQVTKAKITSLEEELKRKAVSIAKITASKEQYKEVSLNNYREAHKLQDELKISRKEVAALKEQNARNLEDYEGASFECNYLFWKNNPNANFSYLPDYIREEELARCVARLEEETLPRSPEISLATDIEGAREEVGDAVDQQQQKSPQDPPKTS